VHSMVPETICLHIVYITVQQVLPLILVYKYVQIRLYCFSEIMTLHDFRERFFVKILKCLNFVGILTNSFCPLFRQVLCVGTEKLALLFFVSDSIG